MFRITKVGCVGMPRGPTVANRKIVNGGIEGLVMEVMTKPAPVLPLYGLRFDIREAREVFISAITTAIGVSVSVFVPGTIETR